MIIDLRSDTLTRPTTAMLQAMMQAEVGDDVFQEDPTVNRLQDELARMFGMEAGLFCPSGTMTNQIAIRLHTQPQDEVICDKLSHIYLYEGGGMMANSGVSVKLLEGKRGKITVAQIAEALNPDDVHFPVSRLVSLENTHNKGGGSCYTLAEIAEISTFCKEKGLALHLDGARVFNALLATGDRAADYGQHFDTVSVCLSKGLGAPVGSVLVGSKAHIHKARRIRKAMGGGMRQAGYLAAAGLYALHHHVARLSEDHQKAQILAQTLQNCPKIVEVFPVQTNIIIFQPDSRWKSNQETLQLMAENGIKAAAFGPKHIRLVTHLDFTGEMLEEAVRVFERILG